MEIECYIIGSTALLIECVKILQQYKIKIKGIYTADARIKKWILNNNINIYDSYIDFKAAIQSRDFDYLFSIVNPIIIENDLLKFPRKLAINYHDSLLPKYAGVNATAWALHNNEKKHGISWHVMSPIIDGGDILTQIEVPIDQNETLQTLNIKCFEAAIESFSKLISNIILNDLKQVRQDLSQRTFYTTKMLIPTD